MGNLTGCGAKPGRLRTHRLSHGGLSLGGRPVVARKLLHEFAIRPHDHRDQGVREVAALFEEHQAEKLAQPAHFFFRSGREFPARERARAAILDERGTEGLKNLGPVKLDVEGHAQETTFFAQVGIRLDEVLEVLEVLHHPRTELGDGTARVDEGEDQHLPPVVRDPKRPGVLVLEKDIHHALAFLRLLRDRRAHPRGRLVADHVHLLDPAFVGLDHQGGGDHVAATQALESHALKASEETRGLGHLEGHGHGGHEARDLRVSHKQLPIQNVETLDLAFERIARRAVLGRASEVRADGQQGYRDAKSPQVHRRGRSAAMSRGERTTSRSCRTSSGVIGLKPGGRSASLPQDVRTWFRTSATC